MYLPPSFFPELAKIAAANALEQHPILDGSPSMIENLRHVLADTWVAYQRTHIAHWNVVGMQFVSLHTLFGEQYAELWESLDEIAERIRALGAMAPNSPMELLQLSQLDPAEPAPATAPEMVQWLLQTHTMVGETVRAGLSLAEQAGDAGTMDLLAKRLQDHQKAGWMLRSLLR